MTDIDEFPTLTTPPIREVVCGIIFPPVLAMTGLHQGLFWSLIRDRYPHAEMHPPLREPNSALFSINMPLQRAWYVSHDSEVVIQVQFDRFFLNWRRGTGEYPRFSLDAENSVLARFEAELETFRDFMSDLFGEQSTRIVGTELTKVDSFERGGCWTTSADLAEVLPDVASALPNEDDCEEFAFHLVRTCDSAAGQLRRTHKTIGAATPSEVVSEFSLRGGQMEHSEVRDWFLEASKQVNREFFRSVPLAERYFGKESS